MLSETARAKINLNLLVGPWITDRNHKYFGLHPLSSLVAFADYGDQLSCEISDQTILNISGPFSTGLESDDSNLVLQAYQLVSKIAKLPPLEFKLHKNLPLASGIGGGSADAAAALRLMKDYVDLPEEQWLDIALNLGADVPVCFHSRTCIMTGIGEEIEFLETGEILAAVLVNPNVQIRTGDIFKLFDLGVKTYEERTGEKYEPNLYQPQGTLRDRLTRSENKLQDYAAQTEMVQRCFDALDRHGPITRMSGSGATCFGIFETAAEAAKAADKIKSEFPNWWVQPAMLGDLS
ncbi:MAG: 4-(cytidine 5'-diphospho)-2-C-methyl-D-erythritol kinase [Hellea sp.]|nr:4-(cytidine 5'-diphospho)-2-C-methyl-D-erythritol kinase [Hellea sp.]